MTNKSFPTQVGDDLFSLEALRGRSYVYGYPQILKAFANLKQFNRDDLNIVIEREIYPSYGAIKVPVQGEWLPRAMLRLEPVIDGQVNTTGYLVAECSQYSNTEFIGEIVAVQNLVTPHNKWRVRRASGSPPHNTTQTFLPVYPKYGPSNYTIYVSPDQPPMHQRRHLAMGGNRDGFWPNIDRGNQSTYPRVFRDLSSVSVPCGAYYEASTNHPFTLPELENLCGAIPSFYLEVSPFRSSGSIGTVIRMLNGLTMTWEPANNRWRGNHAGSTWYFSTNSGKSLMFQVYATGPHVSLRMSSEGRTTTTRLLNNVSQFLTNQVQVESGNILGYGMGVTY